jgi:Ni/Co efflux regulator RcnB
MKTLILGLAALATLAGAVPAAAQNVNSREHRQEQRIHQGERSGALTRGEAGRLQQREYRLHRVAERMRWNNGGHLNHWQRARLARMQNHDSRAIYRLKHNDRGM